MAVQCRENVSPGRNVPYNLLHLFTHRDCGIHLRGDRSQGSAVAKHCRVNGKGRAFRIETLESTGKNFGAV